MARRFVVKSVDGNNPWVPSGSVYPSGPIDMTRVACGASGPIEVSPPERADRTAARRATADPMTI